MILDTRSGGYISSAGENSALSSQADASLRVGLTHGRYHEIVARGNCYTASMDSVVNLGTAFSTSVSTLALYNPFGSGVNLSLLWISGFLTNGQTQSAKVALGGCFVQNQAAPTNVVRAATSTNCILGGLYGKGIGTNSCNLPNTPVHLMALVFSMVVNTRSMTPTNFPIDGRIILPPNTLIVIQGVGGGQTWQGLWSMTWEEVPV